MPYLSNSHTLHTLTHRFHNGVFFCSYHYRFFVPCLTGRGASVHSSNVAKQKIDMEEKINQILVYSLLAAKNVLTLEDVALLTGLSKSHLYRLTCTHQIPYYRPNGKQIYFDRSEVEAWMKQNRVATIKETEQQAIAYVVTGKKGGNL